MKAIDIMTPDPRVVTEEEPLSAVARLMQTLDVGMIPVVDDVVKRRLRGVITDRDIAIRHVASGHSTDCPVSSHMSAGSMVVARLEDDIHEVLARMEQRKVRRAPVTDEKGAVVGVISSADIALRVGATEPLEVERFLEAVSRPELVAAR
jgi:CBS domain-containing protein